MAAIFQFKRGQSTTFTEKNLTLYAGEPGFELDTKRLKIGDGTTPWNELPYINEDCVLSGDGKSIIVNDNVLSLMGLDSALEGQSIRKNAQGQLEWYTPADSSDYQTLMDLINKKANSETVYTKEEIDKKFTNLFDGSPDHLDSIKEITEWITTDTMAMIEMQNKVQTIENGAQKNVLEKVQVAGTLLNLVDKGVNIPQATSAQFGVVKSSDSINEVAVSTNGVMEVNQISVEKLTNDDCQLILRGGNAQI